MFPFLWMEANISVHGFFFCRWVDGGEIAAAASAATNSPPIPKQCVGAAPMQVLSRRKNIYTHVDVYLSKLLSDGHHCWAELSRLFFPMQWFAMGCWSRCSPSIGRVAHGCVLSAEGLPTLGCPYTGFRLRSVSSPRCHSNPAGIRTY